MNDVTNNTDESQYELRLESAIAVAQYRLDGSRLLITHVEVPKALEGKGIASHLMAGVVEHAKAQGLQIVPICPFAAAYLKRHPQ